VQVEEQRDSALPYFLLYDAVVLLTLLLGFAARAYVMGCAARAAPERRALAAAAVARTPASSCARYSDEMMKTSLYYVKVLYGVAAFPFLVFNVPIVGPALHRSKPTGYDKAGMLVPLLSNTLIRAKLQQEHEEEEAAAAAEEKKYEYEAVIASGVHERATGNATVKANTSFGSGGGGKRPQAPRPPDVSPQGSPSKGSASERKPLVDQNFWARCCHCLFRTHVRWIFRGVVMLFVWFLLGVAAYAALWHS
jgi:hypothetical protein